jgi:hypothetical protein
MEGQECNEITDYKDKKMSAEERIELAKRAHKNWLEKYVLRESIALLCLLSVMRVRSCNGYSFKK